MNSSHQNATPLIEFFRHHGLWAPGVRLFRQLQFRAKALTILAVMCVPLAVLGWSFFGDKAAAMGFAGKEHVGIEYARRVLPLVEAAQRLRAGDPRAGDVWDRQLRELEPVEAQHGATLDTAKALAALRAVKAAAGDDWQAAHEAASARVAATLTLLTQVADGSNLTLDPDLDTYYLMDAAFGALPQMIESTAKLRDIALAQAQGKTGGPSAELAMARAEALGDFGDERLASGMAKVYDQHPEMKQRLQEEAARRGMKALHEMAASGNAQAADLARTGDAALESLRAMQRATLEELDQLLLARHTRLEVERDATAVVVLVALLLAGYLFHSFFLVTHGGLREVQKHLEAMTAGDLTTQPRPWGRDEAARLMASLSDMQAALREIVSQVRGASDNIVHSSDEISTGATDLSSRTEQAAANLQESASAMEEMASSVRTAAESAHEAAQQAAGNAQLAQRGGEIIGSMVQTMTDIHGSSQRIGDIISVIDGIAFQTNILALNAAVEAARAGESGRGFAVVASEVRALAQRSASAAREIKQLITASVGQVESGTGIMKRAGATIEEIVGSAGEVRTMLDRIAIAANEQARGVQENSTAVHQLDAMTQQNAALVEQTAAAASSLHEQARQLAERVAKFRLPEKA